MAGGRGTRLNSKVEKPLYDLNGKPLIEYVLDNFRASGVDKIIVALSPHTPITKRFLLDLNFTEFNLEDFDKVNESFMITPGDGYLKDYNYILSVLEKHSKKDTVVFLNSDMPCVNSEIINSVLDEYNTCGLDALSVFVPVVVFNFFDIEYKYKFNNMVPSGLNIVRSENIIQKQKDLIISNEELALNANTRHNVHVAEDYLKTH